MLAISVSRNTQMKMIVKEMRKTDRKSLAMPSKAGIASGTADETSSDPPARSQPPRCRPARKARRTRAAARPSPEDPAESLEHCRRAEPGTTARRSLQRLRFRALSLPPRSRATSLSSPSDTARELRTRAPGRSRRTRPGRCRRSPRTPRVRRASRQPTAPFASGEPIRRAVGCLHSCALEPPSRRYRRAIAMRRRSSGLIRWLLSESRSASSWIQWMRPVSRGRPRRG